MKVGFFFNNRIFVIGLAVLFSLSSSGCAARHEQYAASGPAQVAVSDPAVNINTASAAEIENIQYIGPKLAQKIVEFREAHGPFRRAEYLMLVPGISDKRFRQIRSLIKTE